MNHSQTSVPHTSLPNRLISIAVFVAITSGAIGKILASQPTRLERTKTNHGYVSVTYPPDFKISKTYSILYWFHGTSGRPDPGIGSAAKNYVTVGMSYLKAPHIPPGEYGKSHWNECLAIRTELEAAGLKLDRDVVGGVSKGGWVSFQIGIEVPDGPDGVAVVAAGKPPGFNEIKKLPESLSVLVGVGETDPNYPHSQNAVAFFRESGARLCYEEWLGKGHVSLPSERVLDWLRVEALRGRPAELSQYANATIQKKMIDVDSLSDPRERYTALRTLIGHPALPHADSSLLNQAREKGRTVSSNPELTDWLTQFNELRALVNRETAFYDGKDFDPAKLKPLVGHYRKFAETSNDPTLAARAAFAAVRTMKLVEIEELKSKAHDTPEFIALDTQFKEKLKEFQNAPADSKQRLFNELNPLLTKINTMRNTAAMDAFHKVEWRPLKIDDPVISSKIAADAPDRIRVYLGSGY